uniref:Odorant binding protein n=1 Tax=Lissorhoptrus oryzophilus TaxID=308863 RepID=A0A0B4KZC7_9CUCU|nr:odorant binding protein [Lissorhoptrus oryzophilus]
MKQFVALVLFAVVASSLANNKEATKESWKRVYGAHQKCSENPETHVDHTVLRAVISGKQEPPSNYGAHCLCVAKNLGWMNEDNTVNKAMIQSRAEAIFGSNPKLQQVVDECTEVKGTPEATAAHITKCYVKYAPRPVSAPVHAH